MKPSRYTPSGRSLVERLTDMRKSMKILADTEFKEEGPDSGMGAMYRSFEKDAGDAATALSEQQPSIPLAEIEREADHIEKNGISLAKFGGQEIHEGRCRELCAMYLREFVRGYHMSERLKSLPPSPSERNST